MIQFRYFPVKERSTRVVASLVPIKPVPNFRVDYVVNFDMDKAWLISQTRVATLPKEAATHAALSVKTKTCADRCPIPINKSAA